MRALVAAASIGLFAGAACNQQAPPPYGEALFVVDTDLPVPAVVNRLRVDLYASDGTWFDSRDYSLPDPTDWPTSFGVYAGETTADKDVLVRLRAYGDGNVRDYRGERYHPPATFTPPFVAHSVAQLCANMQELAIGSTLVVRRGRQHISPSFAGGKCTSDRISNAVGSAGAYVNVQAQGGYCFAALATTPADPNLSPFQQVTIQLRSTCDDGTSWIGCEDGVIDFPNAIFKLPQLPVTLAPGRYYLVLSGGVPDWGPTDVTIAAAKGSCAALPPLPYVPPTLHDQGMPLWLRGDPSATPPQEPEPLATVDRLVLARLRYGERPTLHVTLRGDCAGTMAKLGDSGVDFATATTCVDSGDTQVAVGDDVLPASGPPGSVQGTFGSPGADCGAADPSRDTVCVPGGTLVLGGSAAAGLTTPDPPRIAAVSSFWMDRYEVTVARLRAAFTAGLTLERPADLTDGPSGYCTYTPAPDAYENFAATCISHYGARAYCNFVGGDLPTEAQWDYAARFAGGAGARTYPWGDDAPRCTCAKAAGPCHSAVFGRTDDNTPTAASFCPGDGPLAVDAAADPNTGDVTPLGIVGLAGGVAERVLDDAQSLTSDCWRAAGVLDASCQDDDTPQRVIRGGTFSAAGGSLLPADRHAAFVGGDFPVVGFRCVYAATPRNGGP